MAKRANKFINIEVDAELQFKLEELSKCYHKEKKYYLYSEIFRLGVEAKHKKMQKER